MAASIGSGSSAFFQPKLGVSAPSFESISPGAARECLLAAAEGVEARRPRRDSGGRGNRKERRNGSGLVRHRKFRY
ncbi:hypothetical protein CFP56_009991 [Quercus suber]|uniref:Uncharacterized protein n=1 Tax=Quercus suber TaxID=58331 RepID=A0AAW0L2G2_QUESU